jgi:dTDP-4-amino-4,6-dideoxygalactose transaminase
MPLHRYVNGASPALPGAEAIYERALSIPLYPALAEEQANHVVKAVRDVFGNGQMTRSEAGGSYARI